ncbi:unnamed protein product [Prorocentrum cordatum]|uniref:Uncharacterized protein n=1 Tax=Prorocentrum cordatum TaxID=2364126 RepID=A0ABN9T442_9DINO|nr:unnamed protein product [Polarella glacialis]
MATGGGRTSSWLPGPLRTDEAAAAGPSAARRAARARARLACEAALRRALGSKDHAPGSWRDREVASRPALQALASRRRVPGAARRRRNAAWHAADAPVGGFTLAKAAAGPRLGRPSLPGANYKYIVVEVPQGCWTASPLTPLSGAAAEAAHHGARSVPGVAYPTDANLSQVADRALRAAVARRSREYEDDGYDGYNHGDPDGYDGYDHDSYDHGDPVQSEGAEESPFVEAFGMTEDGYHDNGGYDCTDERGYVGNSDLRSYDGWRPSLRPPPSKEEVEDEMRRARAPTEKIEYDSDADPEDHESYDGCDYGGYDGYDSETHQALHRTSRELDGESAVDSFVIPSTRSGSASRRDWPPQKGPPSYDGYDYGEHDGYDSKAHLALHGTNRELCAESALDSVAIPSTSSGSASRWDWAPQNAPPPFETNETSEQKALHGHEQGAGQGAGRGAGLEESKRSSGDDPPEPHKKVRFCLHEDVDGHFEAERRPGS